MGRSQVRFETVPKKGIFISSGIAEMEVLPDLPPPKKAEKDKSAVENQLVTGERGNVVAWAQGEKPGPPDLQALNGDRRLSGVIWETFGFVCCV